MTPRSSEITSRFVIVSLRHVCCTVYFNREALEIDRFVWLLCVDSLLLSESAVSLVLFWCDLMMRSHPCLSAIFHSLRDVITRCCFLRIGAPKLFHFLTWKLPLPNFGSTLPHVIGKMCLPKYCFPFLRQAFVIPVWWSGLNHWWVAYQGATILSC